MTGKLTGGRVSAGVDCGKTPLDGRFMGLDVVDLFFNLNLPGFQSFLPGFQSFKYGDHFIEYFCGSAAITCRVLYRTEELAFVQFRTADWPGYKDFSNYARVALFPEHLRPADPQSPRVLNFCPGNSFRDRSPAAASRQL